MSTLDEEASSATLQNNDAVNNFIEYLQIPSVQPDVDYDECIAFLEKQARSLELPLKIYYCAPKKPIVIITWIGQEPDLPSVLLNSHMDVVPVFEDEWTHKPFGAEIDEFGNIYARGTQDMKSVGIQHLEAIRKLKKDGTTLKRTVHISFVPDEEIGSKDGMKKFIETKDFQDLNVGVGLDEGRASANSNFNLFYGERCIWQMHIHCPGQTGHGSLLLENTAGEKLNYILSKFYEFRKQEVVKLKDNPLLTTGDITTVNLTQLMGGVQANVIPPELEMVIDCRIPVTIDLNQWEETINQWCREAGEGVWITYEQKEPLVLETKLDDTNAYWITIKNLLEELALSFNLIIAPGGTDARYLRSLGIPAFGFLPINDTPVLSHDNDEHINANTFLHGIDIFCKLIPALANVEESKISVSASANGEESGG